MFQEFFSKITGLASSFCLEVFALTPRYKSCLVLLGLLVNIYTAVPNNGFFVLADKKVQNLKLRNTFNSNLVNKMLLKPCRFCKFIILMMMSANQELDSVFLFISRKSLLS